MDKINYQDFQKLDIRIAKIIKAEEVEGADKLLKLTLDVGDPSAGSGQGLGERTIVSGIRLQYEPAELEGKLILYLSNLEPRVLKGVESQGMLLAAVEEKDGEENIALLLPDKDIPSGTKVS